jgi:hypothetical protein
LLLTGIHQERISVKKLWLLLILNTDRIAGSFTGVVAYDQVFDAEAIYALASELV